MNYTTPTNIINDGNEKSNSPNIGPKAPVKDKKVKHTIPKFLNSRGAFNKIVNERTTEFKELSFNDLVKSLSTTSSTKSFNDSVNLLGSPPIQFHDFKHRGNRNRYSSIEENKNKDKS